MTIDWALVVDIAAPLLALVVGAALNHALEARPRLISYLAHASAFRSSRPDGSPFTVHTHSVVLRNSGKKSATNVRLGHNRLPDFQVYPDVQYQVLDLPNGGKEILFPVVVPQKQITVSYLYFPPVTWDQINSHLESDEGPVKVITVLPTAQLPKWQLNALRVLVYLGLVTAVYLVYLTGGWLVAHAT
jgi:hypothetical protein